MCVNRNGVCIISEAECSYRHQIDHCFYSDQTGLLTPFTFTGWVSQLAKASRQTQLKLQGVGGSCSSQ